MEISYWSDIACPFCYIGASRMKRAMAAVGLKPGRFYNESLPAKSQCAFRNK